MNNTIQLNRGSALMEALATATAPVLLKLLTSMRVNITLASVALVCLLSWLISGDCCRAAITWTVAWVLHFAAMSYIDIRKGGAEL